MNVLPRQKEKIMMKKKILVLALAAAMTFETVAPAIAFADELPAEDTAIVCEEPAAAAEETDIIIEENETAAEATETAGEETAAENEESAPAAEEETPENEEPAPAAEEEAPVNEEAAPASEKSAEEKAKEMLDEKASEEEQKSRDDEFFSDETGKTGDSEAKGNGTNIIGQQLLKEHKMLAQQTLNGLIDQMCKSNPTVMFLGAPLKAILSEVFGIGSGNPNAVVLEKIAELKVRIDEAEENVKRHISNVVSMNAVGGEFTKLNSLIRPLNNKINDIKNLYDKGYIDEDEKIRVIGELYSSTEYGFLVDGLSSATNAYKGVNSNTLEGHSIFDAAFKSQAEANMFSGEVIDAITPYLMRQLAIYLNACTLINEVLDNYELSRGFGAAEFTRSSMERDLEDVLNSYNDFFDSNRYIFVNHGKSNVCLNRDLVVTQCFENSRNNYIENNARAKSIIANNPLSSDQIKAVASYAAAKGVSLFDFLFNKVGFRPVKYTAEELQAFAAKGEVVMPYAYQTEDWPGVSGNYVRGDSCAFLVVDMDIWVNKMSNAALANLIPAWKAGEKDALTMVLNYRTDLLIFQAA